MESAAIVVDRKVHRMILDTEPEPHLGGLRMFQHVVERFLHSKENVMAQIRPQWVFRQIGRYFLPATHQSVFEKFIREPPNVFSKATQVIVFWIGGPDDFV